VYTSEGGTYVEAEVELNDDELLGSSTLAKITSSKPGVKEDSKLDESETAAASEEAVTAENE
ncbi:MAG: hypothetical protein AAGU25_10145, partial [bacterium]